ncbi:hypothetical protein MA16_Dca014892 [Dendrobium catenatum]|uniref:Uncharacterized protein n=1 Tax=Dendrobium catenatum TaxID=906689 RepID=A0A2I0WSL3_9ASPA|nr:hypothetical protein MA16_Dca014892 [Dendrobium catenatum]
MKAFTSSSSSSSSCKKIMVTFLVLLLVFPIESREFPGDPLFADNVGLVATNGLRREAREGVLPPPTPETNHNNPAGPNPKRPGHD